MAARGRAWKFGDNVTTDHITLGKYMHLRSNLAKLAKHTLEDTRPDFSSSVRTGDFVVAGKNFGAGSSREHAPTIIKMLGVSAILAKSFARIFYRNAINIGLPAIVCDTSAIKDGDMLEVNLQESTVKDLVTGIETKFKPLPKEMMKILSEGGIVNYVKKYGGLRF